MILSSYPAKLKLPLVSDVGATYVKPDMEGGTNSEIYNINALPSAFKNVKISIPEGYVSAKTITPEIGAKAQSLLKERSIKNLPYNYGETFLVEENGTVKEYLALVTVHFDNHPRRTLDLPTGEKVSHPPFWHPGVSVFEKKNGTMSYDKYLALKEKSTDNIDDIFSNQGLLQEILSKDSKPNKLKQEISMANDMVAASKKNLLTKISNIIQKLEAFSKTI